MRSIPTFPDSTELLAVLLPDRLGQLASRLAFARSWHGFASRRILQMKGGLRRKIALSCSEPEKKRRLSGN